MLHNRKQAQDIQGEVAALAGSAGLLTDNLSSYVDMAKLERVGDLSSLVSEPFVGELFGDGAIERDGAELDVVPGPGRVRVSELADPPDQICNGERGTRVRFGCTLPHVTGPCAP